jgi:hypothetical protein
MEECEAMRMSPSPRSDPQSNGAGRLAREPLGQTPCGQESRNAMAFDRDKHLVLLGRQRTAASSLKIRTRRSR